VKNLRPRRRNVVVTQGLAILLIGFASLGVFGQASPAPAPPSGLPSGPGWHELANTQMRSVCLGDVPDGQYTDATMTATKEYSFDCNQIIPWSGGAADDEHQRLIVWGGGHGDYAGNEVSVLNLSGTPAWERFTGPTMPIPYVWDGKHWEGLKPYFVRLHDGGRYQPGASPSSRHTYNGLQYVPYQNKLYSFGGSVANGGYLSQETWALDMGTKTWTMLGPPFSQSPAYPTTAYNPSNGHIVMHDKNWSLFDYDPHTNKWKILATGVHVDDGTTAAIDPVNNLFVVVGAGGTHSNTSFPSVPKYHTLQVFSLSGLGKTQTWNNNGCDLTFRSGGLAWDSALGLMVGYPGGGNQVYLLNTGPKDMVTPFGTVSSHRCLDVAVSTKSSPVKGVDYPPDPEGTGHEGNLGVYGRFAYFPSLDIFVLVNDRGRNAWVLRLTDKTDKKSAP
jgi:Galactose oxidase, central domain